MIVNSYAKINLILEILHRREDGFHEIQSIMQTVSLHDEIELVRLQNQDFQFECEGLNVDRSDNLVWKAANRFFAVTQKPPSVRIRLKKNIPVGAGLGGGSSNAAITLRSLNKLWNNPLSHEQIVSLASELGSDVPFFLTEGTALAEGRGEKVTPLPFVGGMPVVLINPGFFVSTAHVFTNLKLDLTSVRSLPNILPVFLSGRLTKAKLFESVKNDLQDTVLRVYPRIHRLLEWLIIHGAEMACVSGSGGTVFGLFLDPLKAADVVRVAEGEFPWAYLAETVDGIAVVG